MFLNEVVPYINFSSNTKHNWLKLCPTSWSFKIRNNTNLAFRSKFYIIIEKSLNWQWASMKLLLPARNRFPSKPHQMERHESSSNTSYKHLLSTKLNQGWYFSHSSCSSNTNFFPISIDKAFVRTSFIIINPFFPLY